MSCQNLTYRIGIVIGVTIFQLLPWSHGVICHASERTDVIGVQNLFGKYVNANYGTISDDATEIYYGNYVFKVPIDWSCKDIDDVELCFYLNGFLLYDHAYQEYKETGDKRYQALIVDAMMDWIEKNPVPLEGGKWPWYDDAVGRRVYRFSYYYSIWEDEFTPDQKNKIRKSLKRQMGVLKDDNFYTWHHNHGMFQDMAVLADALLVEVEPKKQVELIELAKSRSYEYFSFAFTEDGVHKEHSPGYHINVSQKLLFFREVYEMLEDCAYRDWLSDLYKKTGDYIAGITMPDGRIPDIGDTGTVMVRGYWYPENSFIQFLASGGKDGTMPPVDYLSKPGGYYATRSSWLDSEKDATYLLFMAATHSNAHKHGDDLSFILYHKGDLFVEAGYRNYGYDDLREYAISSYAHNVLCINDLAFPNQIDEDAMETKIVDSKLLPSEKSVTGMQRRIAGIEQTRNIAYNKDENRIYVTDRIVNTDINNQNGTLLFHLAQDIEVGEYTDSSCVLIRGGEMVAKMSIESDAAAYSLEDYQKDNVPSPYSCILFDDSGNLVSEGHLLAVRFSLKKETTVKTEIELY